MQLYPALLSKFQRACPLTFRALCGRRYLLPQKHQASYANQDAGIQRRILVLLGSVLAPDEDSFARRSELVNLLTALRYDLPTLFLDPDPAEALKRTELPPDFATTDVRWPRPGFRLMLPPGLHLGDGETGRAEMQYVDIALCERDDLVRLESYY
jgi:hypothetical protein